MSPMSFLTSPPERSLAAPSTPRAEEHAMPHTPANVSFPLGIAGFAIFTASIVLYATTIIFATLTLNAYFAQTWDVNTFIQAAHRFLDGESPFDLYAQS